MKTGFRASSPRLVPIAAAAFLLAACGSNEPASPFAPTDPAGRLFEPGHVLEVAVDLAPADWDTLRRQSRSWWDVAGAENKTCLVQPFAKPFDWFSASITVDGVRRDRVAVRKKGFLGSLNEERPALKVRFDREVAGQTLLGLERLTLNNSVQDPTWLKQCLSYRVFEKAGLPVPWCNFAHVTVNGRDLGLYVHLESVDRHWVRRHFPRDEGDLWEGEFSDFRTEWLGTFEKKGAVEDDDQTKVDRQALADVAGAVASSAPDAQVRPRLEELIDFDGFMRFWATEKVLEHWDGYANNINNFFLYHDPATSRFVFAPAGTDQITVPDPFSSTRPPVSVYATGALCNRLYAIPETRQLYVDEDPGGPRPRLRRGGPPGRDRPDAGGGRPGPRPLGARGRRRAGEGGGRPARLGPRATRRAAEGPRRRTPRVDAAAQGFDLRGPRRGDRGRLRHVVRHEPRRGRLPHRQRRPGRRLPPGAALGPTRRLAGRLRQERAAGPWPVVDLTAEAANGTYYNVWVGVNPERFRAGASGTFDGTFAWGGIGNWNPKTATWTYLGGFVDGSVEIDRASLAAGRPGVRPLPRAGDPVVIVGRPSPWPCWSPAPEPPARRTRRLRHR